MRLITCLSLLFISVCTYAHEQEKTSIVSEPAIIIHTNTVGFLKKYGPGVFQLASEDGRTLIFACSANQKRVAGRRLRPAYSIRLFASSPDGFKSHMQGFHFSSEKSCQNLKEFFVDALETAQTPHCSFKLSQKNNGKTKVQLVLEEKDRTFLSRMAGIWGQKFDTMINGKYIRVPVTEGVVEQITCDNKLVYLRTGNHNSSLVSE